jgi:hypothetical protein
MRAAWARSCCDRSWGLIGSLGVRLSVTHESDSAACRRFNDFEDTGRKRAQVLDHIDAADVEQTPVAPEEFDDRHANRIGTFRRSRGEDAVRPVVGRRRAEQLEPF